MIGYSIFSKTKPLFDYLKSKQDNQHFWRSIEITATFSLISFFLLFAIKPTVLTISALVGEIKSKELLNESMKSKINNIIIAQDNFSQIQSQYSIINASLPDSSRFSHAATQLLESAKLSGVNYENITFVVDKKDTDKTDDNTETFFVSVGSRGTIGSINNFLGHLLSNRRLMRINSLNLATIKNESVGSTTIVPAGYISFNFGVDFYYWPAVYEKK